MAEMNFPEKEEKILKFWKKNRIFEKSIEQRPKNNPASFYDGPPFVTGVPHYGHLLGSIAKDVIPRYLTMKGKRVRRVWGWDCHGLPIENKVEQKLGLKDRRDIEKIGLLKFINECKSYVSQTSAEWNWYVDRVGRWVDMDHAYKTMDLDYMESVIWVFKNLYDKDLIYKGMRISLFCPRCSTPISNFEIAMDNSYSDREDTAVILKFKVIDDDFLQKHNSEKPLYLLAWTTTPWSCVSVMGLAIGASFEYQIIETEKERYLVAKIRAEKIIQDADFKIEANLAGKEVVGIKYEHLFDYYNNRIKDFKTYAADYVSQEEGTGIVTINGAFGDVDMDSSKKYGLPIIVNVDEEGKFTSEVKVCPGVYVKEAERLIIDDLNERHLLFREEKIIHSYPFCYRCETPLIYRAQDSWFIDIGKMRQRLLDNNQNIHWVPEHFKEGRFSEGIKSAPDWCVSRTRYWATAMPIWECDKCDAREVFGSIVDIEKRSKQKVKDLHRPFIDEIIFPCAKCSGQMKRVKDVLDCWLDSGSMPYAERHYPFENKESFEKSFPADYISEYTGQVRAWFYVLHVLATALFDSNCFKNVVVSGVIMGTDGRKMSKAFHNYPDPKAVLEKYGGDALRLYLMGSPTMAGQDMNISEPGIKEQLKNILLIYWNCWNYFKTFADFHGFDPKQDLDKKITNPMDAWVLSRANGFLKKFTELLNDYRLPEAVRMIPLFLDDLSRWYIRRSRERLKSGDKKALSSLYRALLLFTKAVAPFIPFITEEIYKGLAGSKESVHLEDWPNSNEKDIDVNLEEKMALVRNICALALAERSKLAIKVRQPLSELKIKEEGPELRELRELLELIKEEANVKEIVFDQSLESKVWLNPKIDKDLENQGLIREIIRNIQAMRKAKGLKPGEKIVIGYFAPQDSDFLIEKNKQTILRETFGEVLQQIGQDGAEEGLSKEFPFKDGKLKLAIKKKK